MEHTRTTTSAEVWAVLKAAHPELRVFSTYSAPDGNSFGTPEMMTEYGFDGAPCPLIGARTTWEKGEKDWGRVNEVTRYWLCSPLDE